jgi:hypothetical protein
MVENGIDPHKAKDIVRKFLEQSQTVHEVKDPELEQDAWIVEADVRAFGTNYTRKVKVDTESGRIMGYDSHHSDKRGPI